LTSYLIHKEKYEPGNNLLGFPYDYRYIGDYDNRIEYYVKIKEYIEKTRIEHDSGIVAITHSLGGLLFHNFLIDYVSETWKRNHIDTIINVNVPFGGVPQSLFTLFDESSIIYHSYSKYSGLHLCFPNYHNYSNTTPLIEKVDKDGMVSDSITIDNIFEHELFNEYDSIHYTDLKSFWDTLLKDTNIKTKYICSKYINDDNNTNCKLNCKKQENNKVVYEYIDSFGDGLVPFESLILHKNSVNDNAFTFINNTSHANILKHCDFLEYIATNICRHP